MTARLNHPLGVDLHGPNVGSSLREDASALAYSIISGVALPFLHENKGLTQVARLVGRDRGVPGLVKVVEGDVVVGDDGVGLLFTSVP